MPINHSLLRPNAKIKSACLFFGVLLLAILSLQKHFGERHFVQLTSIDDRFDLEWNWYHYHNASNKNNTSYELAHRRNLLIAQYTGPEEPYLEFVNITQRANRAYAHKWKYDYLIMKGVAYTYNGVPGDATYNKLAVLRQAMDANIYDAILLIDADAVIVDLDQDALDLIPKSMLVTAFGVQTKANPHTWDVNIGVTIWNLRHAMMNEVYNKWLHAIIQRQRSKKTRKWIPDDQAPLQKIFENYGLDKRQTMVNAINTTHFMYDRGTFIKHVVRQKQTWSSSEEESIRRKKVMDDAVQQVCTKWANACDTISGAN